MLQSSLPFFFLITITVFIYLCPTLCNFIIYLMTFSKQMQTLDQKEQQDQNPSGLYKISASPQLYVHFCLAKGGFLVRGSAG